MSKRKHKNADERPYPPFLERPVVTMGEEDDLRSAAIAAAQQRAFLWPFPSQAPVQVFVDASNRWVVQAWRETETDGTPWEGSLRVAFKYHAESGNPDSVQPIKGWDVLQKLKEHLWPGQIGLEVYPTADQLVNVADMRWMWVLPESVKPGPDWPFNLNKKVRAI